MRPGPLGAYMIVLHLSGAKQNGLGNNQGAAVCREQTVNTHTAGKDTRDATDVVNACQHVAAQKKIDASFLFKKKKQYQLPRCMGGFDRPPGSGEGAGCQKK